MEQERNVVNGAMTVALADWLNYLEPIKWLAFCGIILVFCDLRFGVMAAKVRGEKIRKSRAMRRTINKLVDYTCWILLSVGIEFAFGMSLHIPLIPVFVMLVIYGIEFNSVFQNYFDYRGINAKVNIFNWFKKKGAEIIEVEEKEKEDKQ
jgi:hypothetical protein